MINKAIMALVLSGAFATAQAGVIFQEDFNNVGALTSSGWSLTNNGTAGGFRPVWFQAEADAPFDAHDGTRLQYIAANYDAAPAGGQADTWLITREFSTATNIAVSLWLRADNDVGYSDQVAFGFSHGSAATADFVMAPAFTVPIDGWHQYTLNMLAQGPGTKARFAIQYAGAVDGMNYVGLDTLVVATSDAPPPAVVPEPATAFVLGSGLVGMLAARRRRQQRAA